MEPFTLLKLKKRYHIAIDSAYEMDDNGKTARLTEQDVSKQKTWNACLKNFRNETITFNYSDGKLVVTVRTMQNGKDVDTVVVHDENGDVLQNA